MMRVRSFMRSSAGASAAEFAMVLPLALAFLLGIIDVGRYVWALNELEKAAQMGARFAVATAIVPQGLNSFETIGLTCDGSVLKAGDVICAEALGTIVCRSSGGSASCTCATGPCPDLGAANSGAFNNIVARVRAFSPAVTADDVTVTYSGSGLGFAGDPSVDDGGNPLSDIAPVVSVAIGGQSMRAAILFGGTVDLPRAQSSLTLEDGDGAIAN